ncbi:DUF6993 domain-containing protein [Paramicrobacterium chengjingii]|uniref:DUF6993 domain-containing protein n=1 Tax=Paramicrobacterium chengjingii TaxID=2769067 RepID=A0ABX6YE90_9MICO|nr:hypothetical protein [Microbacterium chengjingii]QPZ37062.1 hypothetical protein HCR76_09225 [Microbacterium chengjingii]
MGRTTARLWALGGTLLLTWVLCGCAPAVDSTAPQTSTGSPVEETSPPAQTELVPDGSAEDNLGYFDAVNTGVLAENPDAMGMDFINALVEAGFDKSAMQVTEDYSTVGNRAESIQFSVRWNDQCLIGQNGEAVGGYHSVVMDALDSGTCLIGNTRDIE